MGGGPGGREGGDLAQPLSRRLRPPPGDSHAAWDEIVEEDNRAHDAAGWPPRRVHDTARRRAAQHRDWSLWTTCRSVSASPSTDGDVGCPRLLWPISSAAPSLAQPGRAWHPSRRPAIDLQACPGARGQRRGSVGQPLSLAPNGEMEYRAIPRSARCCWASGIVPSRRTHLDRWRRPVDRTRAAICSSWPEGASASVTVDHSAAGLGSGLPGTSACTSIRRHGQVMPSSRWHSIHSRCWASVSCEFFGGVAGLSRL